MRVGHSGDLGDLIYGLRIVSEIPYGPHRFYFRCRKHPLFPVTTPHTAKRFEYLKPLVARQPYIMSTWFDPWRTDDDINLDNFRNFVGSGLNLLECHARAAKVYVDTTKRVKWLHGFGENAVAPIVVHRSFRHRNENFPWDLICHKFLFGRSAIFVGSEEEYDDFKRIGKGINLPHYPTPSIVDLVATINGCQLFLGNQSAPRAIAEALGKDVIVESYMQMPNTDFKREGAVYLHNYLEVLQTDLTPVFNKVGSFL